MCIKHHERKKKRKEKVSGGMIKLSSWSLQQQEPQRRPGHHFTTGLTSAGCGAVWPSPSPSPSPRELRGILRLFYFLTQYRSPRRHQHHLWVSAVLLTDAVVTLSCGKGRGPDLVKRSLQCVPARTNTIISKPFPHAVTFARREKHGDVINDLFHRRKLFG